MAQLVARRKKYSNILIITLKLLVPKVRGSSPLCPTIFICFISGFSTDGSALGLGPRGRRFEPYNSDCGISLVG